MGAGLHVTKRSGTRNWYARAIVPPDLRCAFGKAEIWRTLGTADKKEAERKAAPIFRDWLDEFDRRRRTRPATDDDLQRAAFEHYATLLEDDRSARLPLPSDSDERAEKLVRAAVGKPPLLADLPKPSRRTRDQSPQPLKSQLAGGVVRSSNAPPWPENWQFDQPLPASSRLAGDQDRRNKHRSIRASELATGEIGGIRGAADAFIHHEQLDIKRGSPAYLELCQRLLRAELEALDRAEERDRGDWGGAPKDPAVKAPDRSKTASLTAKPGERITDLFEKFYRENKGRVLEDTWQQNRQSLGLFAEYVGVNAHVTAITRKAVSGWKRQLMLYPRKAAGITQFRGLDFQAVIAKNATLQKPVISDKTVNKYLSGLGKFCIWLLANDYIEADVMRGQFLGLDKSKRVVVPYRNDQLSVIFGSPIFTGCERDGREYRPGALQLRDWRFWIPLLSLYSGARLGELCQLLTADVRTIGQTPVMHITDEGGSGNKRTKTAGSRRVVPIHSKLVALGFLDFHAARVAANDTRLFPQLTHDQRGQFGQASRFFGRYFERIGVKADASQNFHSFRHGIADAFRRAGYRNEEFAPIFGHVKETTTARYGILREGELSKLRTMIEAVEYEGLSFDHIPLGTRTRQ